MTAPAGIHDGGPAPERVDLGEVTLSVTERLLAFLADALPGRV